MKPLETFIEQRKERFVKNNLMSDEFLDFVNKNMKPIEKQDVPLSMCHHGSRDKIQSIKRTVFLEYDPQPIEDIKSQCQIHGKPDQKRSVKGYTAHPFLH